MKEAIVLLITFSFVMLMACNNTAPKNAEDFVKQAAQQPGANAGTGKFSMSVPEGWEKIDTVFNGFNTTFLLSPLEPGSTFRANINVVTESLNGYSFDDYFRASILNMEKYLKEFSDKGRGEQDVNGLKAKWLKYSQKNSNGQLLECIVYMIAKDGIGYGITFSGLPGDITKYQDDVNHVLNSFAIE